jgi:hypothetical protein
MRISTRQRPVGSVLPAAVAAALLLSGCTGDGDSGSGASSTSAAGTTPADLSTGLLSAESFGSEATVAAIPPEQLQAGTGLAALGKDLTISPEACAGAVQGTQPELDAFDDVAGVSATTRTSVTAEILLRGGPTDGAAAQLSTAVQTCPTARIDSAQLGHVEVAFEAVTVPDLGNGAAAIRYTTSVAMPDGSATTVPALVGVVEDGDRLVVLTAILPRAGGADDAAALEPAAFADLLEEAYRIQADAFG